jgi:hypothetical protein
MEDSLFRLIRKDDTPCMSLDTQVTIKACGPLVFLYKLWSSTFHNAYSKLPSFYCYDFILGHECTWHGFNDIVFSSHTGRQECIATTRIPVSSQPSLQSSPDAGLEYCTPTKKSRTGDNDDGTPISVPPYRKIVGAYSFLAHLIWKLKWALLIAHCI